MNCKVKLWHYLPTRWSGAVAADLYKGPLRRALKSAHPHKDAFKILEDNDRTGYKSKKGVAAKKTAKISTITYPRYSPDLNPLDFFLWNEVERKMGEQKAPANEKAEAYKCRLRRTAMRIPQAVIRKALNNIKTRARAVVEAKGGDIPRD